jgi:hypothetical protein
MKRLTALGATLGAAMLCYAPVSLHRSPAGAVIISIDKADARIGRPFTPGSIAGVHRRCNGVRTMEPPSEQACTITDDTATAIESKTPGVARSRSFNLRYPSATLASFNLSTSRSRQFAGLQGEAQIRP